MNAESKLFRMAMISPWSFVIFLVIPLLAILSITQHVHLPLLSSTMPLLVNNMCFTLFIACRLLWYAAGIRKTIRYGTSGRRPRQHVILPSPIQTVRSQLEMTGVSFDAGGCYGEKHDLGYLGTTGLYAGLLVLLAVGCWDNLRQFSGVLLDGIGPATSLSKVVSYRHINKGLLAASPASLPKMQIISQTTPDDTYPKGATDIALIGEDGKEEKHTLVPGKPVNYGAFDISMVKLLFQPEIVIKDKDSGIPLFDELVTLNPLVQKRGDYSFYGLFQGVLLGGGVYYQPEKNTLMVVISRGGKKVVTDMVFQVDQQVTTGEYILSCAKMGQWSEIHVIHRRHKALLALGGVIAIIGLIVRVAIRPLRVWLEEGVGGCTIWSTSKEILNELKA